jgi:hypothetical protein
MANILYSIGFLVIISCLCIRWSNIGTLILVLSAAHLAIGVCFMIDPRALSFEGDFYRYLFMGSVDPLLVGISSLVFLFLNFHIWWEVG